MRSLSPREKIYLAVFAVTFLWGAWNFRDRFAAGPSSPNSAKRGAPTTAAGPSPSAPKDTAPVPQRAEVDLVQGAYTAPDWASNPFHRDWRRANTLSANTEEDGVPLRLSSIVVRQEIRYAVINGRVILEGDKIEGRTVLRVEADQILVEQDGRHVRLKL